jgi:hypothetical protein
VLLRKSPQPKLPITELPATINLLEEAHRSKPDELAIPSRLGCSKLRPGSLREKNPAKKRHVLAICEDHSGSAASFPGPASSSTPGNAHLDKVAQGHTAHSKPDLNRQPQECPGAPPRGRAGACGEGKPLPVALNVHTPPAAPRPHPLPEGSPKPSQHDGRIRRSMGLVGWSTGADAWQTVPHQRKEGESVSELWNRNRLSATETAGIQPIQPPVPGWDRADGGQSG